MRVLSTYCLPNNNNLKTTDPEHPANNWKTPTRATKARKSQTALVPRPTISNAKKRISAQTNGVDSFLQASFALLWPTVNRTISWRTCG